MTKSEAKAEAEKMIEMFSDNGLRNWSSAKQCALICCDEIIEESQDFNRTHFWQSVKTEIEKL